MQKDYWQSEKRKLTSALEEKILDGKESICYAKLKNKKLPEVLQIFLQNQARAIFKRERPIVINQSKRFDFSDLTFKTEVAKLRELLIEQMLFQADELRKIITLSVTLSYDVITRPAKTIRTILFQTSQERQREDILVILRGLGENLPFINSLIEYLESETREKIDRTYFEEIVREVQTAVYDEHPISAFLSDLTFLQTFFDEVYEAPQQEYATDLLHGMLVERGLTDFAGAFLDEHQEKSVWTISELEQFLERHILVGRMEGKKQRAEQVFYPEDGLDEETRDGAEKVLFAKSSPSYLDQSELIDSANGSQAYLEDEKAPLPLDRTEAQPKREKNGEANHLDPRQYLEERSQPNIFSKMIDLNEPRPEEELHVEPRNGGLRVHDARLLDGAQTKKPDETGSGQDHRAAEPQPRKAYEGTSTDIINRAMIEAQPPGPYPPLHSLIDMKTRNVFVKKIFGKDKVAYVEFIGKLEQTESWKKAKTILDAELEQRRINPFSRDAVKLSDLLFSRYFSRRKY